MKNENEREEGSDDWLGQRKVRKTVTLTSHRTRADGQVINN